MITTFSGAANLFSTSLARLLPGRSSSRYATGAFQREVAVQSAYRSFANVNRKWSASLFDLHFLRGDGGPAIMRYWQGNANRHDAAVELANLWESQVVPASARPLSKRQRADVVMAADTFLSLLAAEKVKPR